MTPQQKVAKSYTHRYQETKRYEVPIQNKLWKHQISGHIWAAWRHELNWGSGHGHNKPVHATIVTLLIKPTDCTWMHMHVQLMKHGHGWWHWHNQAPSIRTKQHGGARKEAFKRQTLAIASKWLFLSLLLEQTPPEMFKAWTEWLMPYRTTSLEMPLFKYEHYSNINDITNNKW